MLRGAWIGSAVLLFGCARSFEERGPDGVDGKGAGGVDEVAIAVEAFAAPPVRTPLRVLVGGDLIPHRPSLAEPRSVVAALEPLGALFATADGVVANYEAATGELDKKAFRLAYAAPPAWLEALPGSGITAVTVANNHACDLGSDGIATTLATATKSGLTVIGGDADRDPWAPVSVASREGKRVCAVAWTTIVNAEGACARSPRLAVATEDAAGRQKVASALERARTTCDATIAIIHGGNEYVPQTRTMMATARQAAESGADAVVIHHPHVASPVVVHTTKDGRQIPLFASVGNLVSNQGESWKPSMFPVLRENRRLVCVNGWTRLGVVADLAFDFSSAPRLDWSFHLVWTDNDHAEDRTAIPNIATRVLDPKADSAIVARLSEDALGPTELFGDPCWADREGGSDGEPSPRCGTTLTKAPPAPAPAIARAKVTRKKR